MDCNIVDRYGRCNAVVDIHGKLIERTKYDYPYSYDPFLIWKSDDYTEADFVVYSDRLYQWDSRKYNKCREQVVKNHSQYFYSESPQNIEKFLSLYFEREIKLTGIEECCNVSNGVPIWTFFYRDA